MSDSVFFVAGDPSGDLYAARVATHLKTIKPDIGIFSAGGNHLEQATHCVFPLTALAVTGIWEVGRYIHKVLAAFHSITKSIDEIKPSVVVLVDYPDFNLRLSKILKKKGYKVFYFISPQVWAWRKKRIIQIKRYVDKIAVIFPFEEKLYREAKISVVYVGHPLLEILPTSADVSEIKKTLSLASDEKVIGLLPGSRKKEVIHHLPMLHAAKEIIAKKIRARFIVFQHPQLPDELFSILKANDTVCIPTRHYEHMKACDLALTASGTVTMELAILGVPSIVFYKLNALSWHILKFLVRVPFIAMPNIIAQKNIFPEFIQNDATPERIAQKACSLLSDHQQTAALRGALHDLRKELLPENACMRTAQEIITLAQA